VSGATGAAGGGAAAGRQGSAQARSQGGHAASGTGRTPGDPPAASTSLMPPVADARPTGSPGPAGAPGHSGGYGYPHPPVTAPPVPGATPTAGAGAAPPTSAAGYSTPTTYAKGQTPPAHGTRAGGAATPRRSAAASSPVGGGLPRTRRARLRVTKVDPWSVMKVSFLLSIALGVVTVVAACLLWMVLNGLGVFDSVGDTLKEVTGTDTSQGFDLKSYLGFGTVFMYTMVIAVVDVILMTALSTLGAFIYNTAAGFSGGVELTLAEED
jgi:hypothetical protein